jgi:hypothetical protein
MSEMYQFASAQDAGEEDTLELRDRRGVPPSLREKDRSLQRRQDEVADFLALEVLRKLAGLGRFATGDLDLLLGKLRLVPPPPIRDQRRR